MTGVAERWRVDVAELRREVVAPALWIVAILAWGVGDLATTWAGYQTAHAVEATPFVHEVIGRWGHAGHAAVKAVVLALGYLYYRRLPLVLELHAGVDEERTRAVLLAIPLAFIAVGTALTLGTLDALLVGGRP